MSDLSVDQFYSLREGKGVVSHREIEPERKMVVPLALRPGQTKKLLTTQ
jgi:hypothetical protein